MCTPLPSSQPASEIRRSDLDLLRGEIKWGGALRDVIVFREAEDAHARWERIEKEPPV